ncbi:MAG: endonuclease III domain-containing protein [Candidatus Micrarchaeia archaeon]
MNEYISISKENIAKEIELLSSAYKGAKYYLNFSTPIELLVAAILSAQTKDSVVNSITPELFKKYRSAKDYANADEKSLLQYIGKVSFASAKAKNIINACKIIEEKYDGKVPDTMNELTSLPGVGRKTANTVLINAFGKVEGIPVDTWVMKLSFRMGLSNSKNPDKIEEDLKSKIDKKYWHNIAYVLKMHGKEVCGTTPKCSECIIKSICPKNGVKEFK